MSVLCFRLADHFGGKLHMGFIKIRDRLKELEVRNYWISYNELDDWIMT